eukprot:symbB.v1.2.041588.t1/scaffold8380.1/size6587/1
MGYPIIPAILAHSHGSGSVSKNGGTMGKFLKAGRIVVMLQGRYAGKKAVVVKAFDDGSKARSFGHCLVAGVDRAPLK